LNRIAMGRCKQSKSERGCPGHPCFSPRWAPFGPDGSLFCIGMQTQIEQKAYTQANFVVVCADNAVASGTKREACVHVQSCRSAALVVCLQVVELEHSMDTHGDDQRSAAAACTAWHIQRVLCTTSQMAAPSPAAAGQHYRQCNAQESLHILQQPFNCFQGLSSQFSVHGLTVAKSPTRLIRPFTAVWLTYYCCCAGSPSKSAMKHEAPLLSALITILRSTGPVISTRRSTRPGAGDAACHVGSLRMLAV
jgi:hypothetical protein